MLGGTHLKLAPFLFLVAAGCYTAPTETSRARAGMDDPRHHILLLTVKNEEAVLGTSEQWVTDLTEVFEALKVSDAAIWPAGHGHDEAEADMVVTITIKHGSRGRTSGEEASEETPSVVKETKLDADGAWLQFLAWSMVPFLPLWVRDVDIMLDLDVTVDIETVERETDWKGVRYEPAGGSSQVECPAIESCYLDRKDFLSWSTLTCILVPPFVFNDDVDTAHFIESTGERIRETIACDVAGVISTCRPETEHELLQDRALAWHDGTLEFSFNAHADLLRVTASLARLRPNPGHLETIVRGTEKRFYYPLNGDSSGNRELLPLSWPPEIKEYTNVLLRIAAYDRAGRVWRYSLPVPAPDENP